MDQLSGAQPPTALKRSEESGLHDEQRQGVKVSLQRQHCMVLNL